MIIYYQLRQKLADVKPQYTDAFESLEEYLYFAEESTFYIYRFDTNAVLARGLQGFEQAKNDPQNSANQPGLLNWMLWKS